MWERIHMGPARTPAAMRTPWAAFSANGILVLGGPETQVWWEKERTPMVATVLVRFRAILYLTFLLL